MKNCSLCHVLFIFLAIVFGKNFSYAENSCSNFYSGNSSSSKISALFVDNSLPRIPFTSVYARSLGITVNENLIFGYEGMKVSRPIFRNPEAVRLFVNKSSASAEIGEMSVDVRRDAHLEREKRTRRPLEMWEVSEAINAEFPVDIAQDLVAYVASIFEDAKARSYPFSKLGLAIRTELFQRPFLAGHSHIGGDLNYASAPIGRNTEIDLKGRFFELFAQLPESDYFSTNHPDQVLVFGAVWHRSPKLVPGETRLYVIVEVEH